MENSRREGWGNYFRLIADEVNLRDWRVIVQDEPCAKDSFAEVTSVRGKKELHIRLHPQWEAFTQEEQREAAVHELIHAHFEQGDWYVYDNSKRYMSSEDAKAFRDNVLFLNEYGFQALAIAFLGRINPIPLPSEAGVFGDGEGSECVEEEPVTVAVAVRATEKPYMPAEQPVCRVCSP